MKNIRKKEVRRQFLYRVSNCLLGVKFNNALAISWARTRKLALMLHHPRLPSDSVYKTVRRPFTYRTRQFAQSKRWVKDADDSRCTYVRARIRLNWSIHCVQMDPRSIELSTWELFFLNFNESCRTTEWKSLSFNDEKQRCIKKRKNLSLLSLILVPFFCVREERLREKN